MTVCKRVYYSGHVQGVGFRYTAQSMAGDYPVVGYVRNLPNGQVELLAQGPADQVDAFIAALGGRMARFIERTTVEEGSVGNYSEFQVRL